MEHLGQFWIGITPIDGSKFGQPQQIKALEAQRNHRRRSLFDAQDQVDGQRAELISNIEGKLSQKVERRELLAVRWTLA